MRVNFSPFVLYLKTICFEYLKNSLYFYLFPQQGYFIVQFVYSEKAVEKSLNCELPKTIVESIKEAQPYVEGRSFRVNVKFPSELEWIMKLIDIKLNTYGT